MEQSFGFDRAVNSYAQHVVGLAFDAVLAKNVYHFIRVMDRSTNHIALKCAL